MNTITDHITVWGINDPRPERLSPTSRLAREVLDIDQYPHYLGDTLLNHHVVRPRILVRRPPTAEEYVVADLIRQRP